MNKKHRKTLEAIFTKPTLATIKFADIEKLLLGLGAELTEGSGSRVVFRMPNNLKFEANRPHTQKEAKKYQVENLREYLERLGVKNE